MKLYRTGAAATLLAGALALTACGSDKNSDTTTPPAGSTTPAGGASSATDCATGSLKAEGSTAQTNAIQQWIKDYSAKCGATIDYNPTGSGAGVKQFTGGQVDFGGSDAALDPGKGEVAGARKQCGGPALDLPMVTGPVAIAFKLDGVTDLTLTPDVIAKIFLGKITTWNDPAIKSLNASADLPSTRITVFFRSDESGTTQNFETYLAAAAPSEYTAQPSKTWSGKAGLGKSKSQGVQQAISSTEGGIGYLEWSFAGSGGLSMARIDNGGGPVELTAESAGKAVSAATVASNGGDDLTLKLDYATRTPGAYPLILVTYEIVCQKYSDPAIGALVKSFLTYASGAGQQGLADLGYAPLPSDIDAKVQAAVAKIR